MPIKQIKRFILHLSYTPQKKIAEGAEHRISFYIHHSQFGNTLHKKLEICVTKREQSQIFGSYNASLEKLI